MPVILMPSPPHAVVMSQPSMTNGFPEVPSPRVTPLIALKSPFPAMPIGAWDARDVIGL